MDNEQRKRKADDTINDGEEEADHKLSKATTDAEEESEKKVKVSAAEENAAVHCFERVIRDVLGYSKPIGSVTNKKLSAQRKCIFSMAETSTASHSFSVAKAAFYKSILIDDTTKSLKYGPRFSSTILENYLNCPIFICLKKVFGTMDPSVDFEQDIEKIAESITTKDNLRTQVAVSLVFNMLIEALWHSSVEEVAQNAYENLLLRNPALPKEADLSSMLSHPDVKIVVSSSFLQLTESIPIGFLQSPLRFTVFDGSPYIGKYAAGGFNIFRDTHVVNAMYELACAFADSEISDEDVDNMAYDFQSNITDPMWKGEEVDDNSSTSSWEAEIIGKEGEVKVE